MLVQCMSFNSYKPDSAVGLLTQEEMEVADATGDNYKEGRGMITISCEHTGNSGVHVFLNGKMKLYISNGSKNLRVSKNDLIYVKGFELEGESKVTVTGVVGKIDSSIVGTSISVGNLGRKLVRIQ